MIVVQVDNVDKCEGSYLLSNGSSRCFLHSVYSIDHELEWMFQDAEDETDDIVLFGLGSGQALPYIFDRFRSLKKLIVVEPTFSIFKHLLHEIEFSQLIPERALDKVILAVNCPPRIAVDTIIDTVSMGENTCVFFGNHVSYRTIFAEYHREFAERVVDKVRLSKIGIRSMQRHILAMTKNSVLNMTVPAHAMENFIDFFKGKTAIIVSAGPSLEKNIHLLEKAKEKAVIVAVGKTVHILNNRGIRPHFRMGLDSNSLEKAYFDDISDTSVPLFFMNMLYHEIAPQYPGPLVRMISRTDNLGTYIYRQSNLPLILFPIGTSVANAAACALAELQCSNIIFVGQDMCSYNNKIYADGQTADTNNTNLEVYHKKDIYGNEVISPLGYYTIKLTLEDEVRYYQGRVRFVNATEGGLGIEGVENVTLKEVLDSLPAAGDIQAQIETVLQEVPAKDFQLALKKLLPQVKRGLRITGKISKLFSKINDIDLFKDENSKRTAVETLKKIQALDKQLQSVALYKEIVEPELQSLFVAFHGFWDNGLSGSEEEQLNSVRNIITRKMIEVHAYLACLKQNIETIMENKKTCEDEIQTE
ncbi:MAG TPA: DUF115 domain-containing protein [Methylomusa anaerophila]|uniref:motility associated factor glycosyltransferase family protein n=1 Tax=Methylomusa anaerophila TaxID=1930071 RepID=UPI002C4D28D4|nr:6-hydroxymethylpterin diphosphokinase MptE-like protein [Methylomusa anaerophila]HML88567.1 DUF115 domain-containing protein [Methylomusa anaerophila]